MGAAPCAPASVLASGEQEGPFALRRNPYFRDGPWRLTPEFSTMQQLSTLTFKAYADRSYLGHRPVLPDGSFAREFKFITYREGYEIAMALGAGLTTLGVGLQTPFGVYSPGCYAWVHTIDASSFYGFAIASLYDTLGPDSLDYLIMHSRMTCILVAWKYYPKLRTVLQAAHHCVKQLIVIESDKVPEVKSDMEPIGIEAVAFDEILARGRANPVPMPEVGPESHYFYSYSSGTTGTPKGVIISHRCFVMAMTSARTFFGNVEIPSHLSFLPYAHVMERAATGGIMFGGGRIGFMSSTVQNILEDWEILRPTMCIAVPRLFARFYDGITAKVAAGGLLNRGIFWGAYKLKKFLISRDWSTKLVDRLVFDRVAKTFGGAVTEVVAAGAAINPAVQEFFQILLGAPLRNGYGCTEVGTATIVGPDDIRGCRPGFSGGPVVHTELRIEPCEGFDDPKCGEIILAGDSCCSGYLYDEEQTRALFVDDTHRAIRTGDVGKVVDGYLKVVDRLRSIFKLSQGEYVAAEMVTQAYADCKYIQQLFVYGDSGRSCLVGIVVVNPVEVAAFLGADKLAPEELERACSSDALRDAVLREMTVAAKEKGLFGFQQVKAISLDWRPWTVENELLTPTLKTRRKAVADHYKEQILEMYRQIEGK
jgi:long-chain acyl-CoA synthetase